MASRRHLPSYDRRPQTPRERRTCSLVRRRLRVTRGRPLPVTLFAVAVARLAPTTAVTCQFASRYERRHPEVRAL